MIHFRKSKHVLNIEYSLDTNISEKVTSWMTPALFMYPKQQFLPPPPPPPTHTHTHTHPFSKSWICPCCSSWCCLETSYWGHICRVCEKFVGTSCNTMTLSQIWITLLYLCKTHPKTNFYHHKPKWIFCPCQYFLSLLQTLSDNLPILYYIIANKIPACNLFLLEILHHVEHLNIKCKACQCR